MICKKTGKINRVTGNTKVNNIVCINNFLVLLCF